MHVCVSKGSSTQLQTGRRTSAAPHLRLLQQLHRGRVLRGVQLAQPADFLGVAAHARQQVCQQPSNLQRTQQCLRCGSQQEGPLCNCKMFRKEMFGLR